MRERTKPAVMPRMVDVNTACLYCGVGRNRGVQIISEAHAARKIGRRTLVDLRILDMALDELPEAE